MLSPFSPCSVSVSSTSRRFGFEVAAALHDRPRELALDRGLDLGHESRRVLVAPRGVSAVRAPIPVLEVDRPGFLDELALVVVDPVAGEWAGPAELAHRRTVGLDRQREGRPGDRGVDAEERLAAHAPGRRHTGAAAGRLGEAHPAVPDLGVVLERRQRDGRDAQLLGAELDPRDADVPAAHVPVALDRAVVAELDEALELVRLAEEVRLAHRVEILDLVGRRIVVVGHAHRERKLGEPLDGLGGNPRDGGNGRLDAHA